MPLRDIAWEADKGVALPYWAVLRSLTSEMFPVAQQVNFYGKRTPSLQEKSPNLTQPFKTDSLQEGGFNLRKPEGTPDLFIPIKAVRAS